MSASPYPEDSNRVWKCRVGPHASRVERHRASAAERSKIGPGGEADLEKNEMPHVLFVAVMINEENVSKRRLAGMCRVRFSGEASRGV